MGLAAGSDTLGNRLQSPSTSIPWDGVIGLRLLVLGPWAALRRRQPRTFVAQAEQLDDIDNLSFRPDGDADPARRRMVMVRHRPLLRHKLLADAHGERDIRQVVSMEVPELPPTDTKLHEMRTVRADRDTGPALDLPGNPF